MTEEGREGRNEEEEKKKNERARQESSSRGRDGGGAHQCSEWVEKREKACYFSWSAGTCQSAATPSSWEVATARLSRSTLSRRRFGAGASDKKVGPSGASREEKEDRNRRGKEPLSH